MSVVEALAGACEACGAVNRARSARDHNAFAKRRRGNMCAGETPAQARARWAADGRCRDCGGALLKDGATGARIGRRVAAS